MKIKVFGYARKSPDDREETEISIENQKKLFARTCNEKDWELVKVFVDANISGGDRERKEFNNMLKEFYFDDTVKFILVKDQSRLARDFVLIRNTLIDVYARDKAIYSIMKGSFLSHKDLGDSVTSVVNEQQIIEGKEKAEILFKEKREEMLPPTTAPFGYENDKKTKSWEIIPKQAKIVLSVVSDYVNNINFATTIKDLGIDKSKYYRIIKNAKNGLYSGFIYYNLKIKDSDKKVIRLEEVKYKGKHTPIISEELYKKVIAKNGV